MKYWETDGDGNYKLIKQERAILFGVSGGYDNNNFWIEENCDNCFSAEYSKQEAIEMLEEAITIIKESK